MRRTSLIALVLVAALGGAGVWYATARPPTVATVEATRGTAAEIVYASGVVEPRRWAKVTSLVRERIVEICDCEGEAVEAGHLLARLDDSEIRAKLQELEARRVLASKELQRAADLFERRVGSEQAWERSAAELAQIEASLAALKEQANDHLITAPIAGQVLRLDASVGEIAGEGEALAWVGNPRPLEVVAEVNEEDIPRVRPGQAVLLRADAFPGQPLSATVASLTPKGDPVLKTYRVRLSLPDDTPLFIGMSVDANIVVRDVENAVVVPTTAVVDGAVFVVGPGDVVERRPVTVGIRGLETVQVTDGLSGGERIVMPVPDGLKPGDRVGVEAAS
ncbi:efflux RND transporter periplasmic adaptor subunit [Chthonobacter rhizosphaerae]|uniref:efflux RND transporter periplasmic adaptor subunit n=1 Tax=Chthonobacter rhizosphaerae TaxID=2735553 RepID=UPI0015EE4EF4|nr:efflux RND transporter periplasmic adaptor subunit [Chthonobacter rhizosphaerae]